MGRFRKGKKAFRSGIDNKLSGRYISFLKKLEQRRIAAIKAAQASAIMVMSAARVNVIRNQVMTPTEKAIAIMDAIVDSAFATSKVYK